MLIKDFESLKLHDPSPMRLIKFLLFLILLSGCAADSPELTTFILVRHAEKGNDGTDDPDLTPEGNSRAEKLSAMFRDTGLVAIYSTDFRRTKNTVAPLAKIHNLEVQQYEAYKPDVIENMVNKHRGGAVLISGHSNTTPWTANLLIGNETYKDYAESEYGIILIITVTRLGKASVIRVNY